MAKKRINSGKASACKNRKRSRGSSQQVCVKGSRKGDSPAALVSCYRKNHRPLFHDQLQFYATGGFDDRLCKAVLAETRQAGMHGHQCRIGYAKLRQAFANLNTPSNKQEIKQAKSFEDIHAIIDREAAQRINGIGELFVYDTALRLAAKNKLFPQMVYLHAGPKEGAIMLGIRQRGQRTLQRTELPQSLQSLAPHECENFLCVCRHCF